MEGVGSAIDVIARRFDDGEAIDGEPDVEEVSVFGDGIVEDGLDIAL